MSRPAILLTALAALLVLALLGICLGARPIAPGDSLRALFSPDPANDLHLVVRELRLPRTLIAVMAGAALGMAGALIQAVTRNPLAEPGLLGVNAGAGVAVIIAVAFLGVKGVTAYVWFAYLGAGAAGALVFFLGRAHTSGAHPLRLVLAGAGLSVALGSLTGIIVINSPVQVLDDFRNWSAGSVEGRSLQVAFVLAASLAAGGLICFTLARGLNALMLGQESGRALGLNPPRIWALACVAVMLLAGGATAAAGPISFVGLVAPHLARSVGRANYGWILVFSALFGALLLLGADIIGRMIAAPDEVAAGIIAMLVGGPFFIWVARRFRMVRA
ncbi:FecCD family ABC transporter permease [Ketogulonicigenium vulgare]|uniref:Achromobactin transport system permease protein cbrB n=1 Tax=Ketogulonicigenium vulgare (strain WSH-001) TaxID=759362 RepID=F9Y4P8_KETVW|nr:iron ABC transporter permease [Ketogulonicigenium vulgare]AEM40605.1 Achromobactin transport system permease protein cbrB [Ketogulonicigenium vulgare WSH-001]ALJ80780.1 ABC transporter permease [Ketogulonicigenium vulgare]AOZ54316.1 Achromobactin transport system permease protein cbrB [Ketogulonicigenium vulgare]